MKYHYQFVSKTSVRIELIPEDNNDTLFLAQVDLDPKLQIELLAYFKTGLEVYSSGAMLDRTTFMNYPKVALCSFAKKGAINFQDH